jgi:hypothetical protein
MSMLAGTPALLLSPPLAISIRRMLWNMPPLYALGGTVLLITIVGLWVASRW